MMTVGVCGPIDLKLLHWDIPKRSLPITNSFPLTSYFVNALLKRGYEVIAYTNSPHITEPQVLKSGKLTVCISREKNQPGRRFFKFEVEDLQKMIKAHPAQVISAFWTYEYALAALGSGIPTLVNIHDVALKILLKQFDPFRVVRWIMNYRVIKKSSLLVANSDYTFGQLSASTKAKTIVIPNFYPDELEDVRNPLGVKGNYIVASSNGFTKRKNIHLALEAFQKVRKTFPDVDLHLVGVDMQENGPAHQYAREKGLAEGVKFVGPLPYLKVLEEVAGAKVLVCPSMEESFGMALLEAMVVGTAVIGGDKSGFVPTLLDHGNAGILCDIYSPDSMAGAIKTLLQDDDLRLKMERTAKQFAKDNFSEEIIINQHLALMNKLLQVKAGAGNAKELHQPQTADKKLEVY
ncbi:glycosyltransferase family 4 protein [Pontibacter populi]|uniref:Glycosyltransferase family 4 protein n=1 Tax=Pontibacter populi TaxID=890055 RepID=A0ABV1RY09_9BACT